MSVITEIVSFGKENISNLATCWAKHSEKVCKKYYIQHFSEREAARISWACYNMYKTPEDVKKAVNMREKIIKNVKVAKSNQIRKWIKDIINKIKLVTIITIEDARLMKELEKLSLQEDGWSFIHTFLHISLILRIYTF